MPTESGWIRQAAAIPLKAGQICLVTSSNGKRWVIPKGMIDPGKTAPEAALQEAWEEAGVVGNLDPDPVGSYFYQKYGGTYHVTVFILRVTSVSENWPERALRLRSWMSTKKALASIEDEGLRELVRGAVRENGE
jgi:8-oxo-dGTP pyrophosphatase MutT (NUDIX family)